MKNSEINKTAFKLPLSQQNIRSVIKMITSVPYTLARKKDIQRLFGTEYSPGTFRLSERKENPDFLYDELDNYEIWLKNMTDSFLLALRNTGYIQVHNWQKLFREIEKEVLSIFDSTVENDRKFCEVITNQQVTDILWRLIKVLLTGNPYSTLDIFREFNELGTTYILELLNKLKTSDPMLSFRYSIIAGAIGLDQKSKYISVGPSRLITDKIISIRSIINRAPIEELEREIRARAKEDFMIDYFDDFALEVLDNKNKTILSFFTDDCFETCFDLWAIQECLKLNHNLQIRLIPRYGIHANDASYEYVQQLLSNSIFADLNRTFGRNFFVIKNGPAGSGINANEFSKNVFYAIDTSDILIFKGARAYEMMQGIDKICYFGFNVLRSFTESLTGLDSTIGSRVFIRQDSASPSYNDFRFRGQRKKRFKKRSIGLARMTAIEYCKNSNQRIG